MKSCFLIGRSESSEIELTALTEAINRHITEYGVNEFIVGGLSNFDLLAAEVVKEAKHEHPNIVLSILLPYDPAEQNKDIPQGYDKVYHPSNTDKGPKWYAMVKKNRKIIDQAQHLIIYNWQLTSYTRDLVIYAQKKEKSGLIQIEELRY